MPYKTIHRKLKIEQREPHLKPGVNSGAPEGLAFLFRRTSSVIRNFGMANSHVDVMLYYTYVRWKVTMVAHMTNQSCTLIPSSRTWHHLKNTRQKKKKFNTLKMKATLVMLVLGNISQTQMIPFQPVKHLMLALQIGHVHRPRLK